MGSSTYEVMWTAQVLLIMDLVFAFQPCEVFLLLQISK